MGSVRSHYEGLLGAVYPWMVGDFEAAAARYAAVYEEAGLAPGRSRRAVDLGAGHGSSTRPLAERGFEVTAVDFCRPLLDELLQRCGDLPVRAVTGDMLDIASLVEAPVDAVVCMGDTLTHLPDKDSVAGLLGAVHRLLAPGGRFVAGFRDYVSRELAGEERFIPVRSDGQRILTCVLEYAEDSVTVYDLLHERGADGVFGQKLSSYRKLRLAPGHLADLARSAGFEIERAEAAGGLVSFVAVRR